jgi:anti-sigma regulatory factor (Ser/Thr protein kinase)
MTRLLRVHVDVRAAMPASLQAVEEFFAEFRRRNQALLDRANCFAAELLLREALNNAVLHGCHADPGKQVRCLLRLRERRLLIAVEHNGDGFDWRAGRAGPAALWDCSGRGIEILRKYSSHVRYNERGNAVAIVKRLSC